ncbi:MAG TPA: hypothetical protein VHL57_03985 [Flavobacteriales bacterium]|jgi:hypothetical protein|nr:hypothetical protein [Flavobacteriales bacterium]
MRHLFLSLAASAALPVLAQLNGPESIEYDPIGDRYLISNTGDGSIQQMDQAGTLTPFVSGLSPAAYGIEVRHDTLFACCGGRVRGFRTSDGASILDIDLDATFLNGITCDERFIYVTDFSARVIYKVDPQADSFTTLVANTTEQPNGIVYDPTADLLRVAFWGTNAKIKGYDRGNGAQIGSFTTNLTNIDGIAIDCNGRILAASWTPDRVTAFDPGFAQQPVDLGLSGLSNPADMDFDAVNNRICVPNSGNNTVLRSPILCDVGLALTPGYSAFNVYPDPTDGNMRVDLPLAKPTPFLVFNVRGLLVASGTLSPDALLDITQLSPGTYIIDLPSIRQRGRVVKY